MMGNLVGAWVLLFVSVPFGYVDVIVSHVLTFITALIGIYTGVGHMDFRQASHGTDRLAERLPESDDVQ
jgi:hypothetical protein